MPAGQFQNADPRLSPATVVFVVEVEQADEQIRTLCYTCDCAVIADDDLIGGQQGMKRGQGKRRAKPAGSSG